jgi:hypothetical protein
MEDTLMPTTLRVLHGGTSTAVRAWEADIEQRVADLIHQHLRNTPPPGASHVADDLARWAELLAADAGSRTRAAA